MDYLTGGWIFLQIAKFNSSFLQKICSLLIVTAPIIAPYNGFLPFLILPEILFLILIVVCFIDISKRKVAIKLGKYKILVFYFFIINLISLLVYFIQPSFSLIEYLKASIRFGFYVFIILFIVQNYFVFRLASKWYLYFSILASVYLIIQSISYKLFNFILPWYIKWLPIHSETYLNADFDLLFSRFYRPSSFFLEPAHFAAYVIPMLAFVLFYKYKDSKFKSILLAAIITVALLLSTSGGGIILASFLWGAWSLKFIKGQNTYLSVLKLILVLVIVFLVVLPVFNAELLVKSLGRLFSDNQLSSSNIRIVRGFSVFSMLPITYKIFGVGYGNYATYVIENSITTIYDLKGNSTWVNASAYILMGTGIIGFSTFLLLFINLFKNTKEYFRILTVVVFISTFYSTNFLSISIVMLLAFILHGYKSNTINPSVP
jgi:hypothetical protein